MTKGLIVPIDLAAKRKAADLTQEKFGELIGFSKYYVLRLEKGKLTTPLQVAVKCVNILGPIEFKDKETGSRYRLTKI
ncbi:transcriptional regulator, XRE family [Desulfofarcimen acetoxidans DSM 771]|uniref:Transcriptional regulator, XRE family n=1 Tax=Desulfofarcimen acetoxidans (strain ATCC 49208 / DSM 771 / KCTC 5769 / VKM B-1644 / 5575) TaxID=485916 RepID=C8W0I2_DESAS|nr:helix-turn-helix transcriptional regulator [Desulfofarcimen acetoxidans]ACV63237.1 transcriptional regulator, XRE family [Desulfofarcimen acetoxidans DSM 771]